MESVDAKVSRAKEHLSAFETQAASFLETTRPRFIRKTSTDQTSHWLVFFTEDPYPPIGLSVLVGDFLYNLRSGLDNLVCGLVRTKERLNPCEGTEFPIFTDPEKYLARRERLLKGVPEGARAIINELQPHVRPASTRELAPLWILHPDSGEALLASASIPDRIAVWQNARPEPASVFSGTPWHAYFRTANT